MNKHEQIRVEKCRKMFLEAIFSSFETSAKLYVIILCDIIVLGNFLLSFSQS